MEVTQEAPSLRYKGYIPGLDLLRGLAILLVLLYHGTEGRVPWKQVTTWVRWPLLVAQYGYSGVELFFVLSGFLISSILIDTAASKDYYRKFYVRRALRILPAYLLLLVVLKVDQVVSWRFVLAALLYVANMASLVGARSSEYGSLWSLAVEEQFYLIWPIVVRTLSLKAITRVILGYYVFVFGLRLACLLYFPNLDLRYKLWFNAEALLSGALISICLRRDLLRRENIDRLIWFLAGLAAITWTLTLTLDLVQGASVWTQALRVFTPYSLLTTYSILLLLVIRSNRGALDKAQQPVIVRFLSFFGYLSYGLYLIHQLIFSTFDRLFRHTALSVETGNAGSLVVNTLICVSISVGLAYVSRRYFEELFLRQKDKVVPYKEAGVNEKPVADSA